MDIFVMGMEICVEMEGRCVVVCRRVLSDRVFRGGIWIECLWMDGWMDGRVGCWGEERRLSSWNVECG